MQKHIHSGYYLRTMESYQQAGVVPAFVREEQMLCFFQLAILLRPYVTRLYLTLPTLKKRNVHQCMIMPGWKADLKFELPTDSLRTMYTMLQSGRCIRDAQKHPDGTVTKYYGRPSHRVISSERYKSKSCSRPCSPTCTQCHSIYLVYIWSRYMEYHRQPA